MSGKSEDLEDVFVEVGEIGPSQIVTYVLLSVLNILSATSTVSNEFGPHQMVTNSLIFVLNIFSR